MKHSICLLLLFFLLYSKHQPYEAVDVVAPLNMHFSIPVRLKFVDPNPAKHPFDHCHWLLAVGNQQENGTTRQKLSVHRCQCSRIDWFVPAQIVALRWSEFCCSPNIACRGNSRHSDLLIWEKWRSLDVHQRGVRNFNKLISILNQLQIKF